MHTQRLSSKKIGLLGGTFDPIHFGHLRMAQESMEQLALDEIRFLPCKIPALKNIPYVDEKKRCEMVKLAIAGESKWVVDERELEREGLSYTIDTLRSLHLDFPDANFYFLMGADTFLSLTAWKEWQQIPSLCQLVVLSRLGPDLKLLSFSSMEQFADKIIHLPSLILEIASSELRKRRAQGLSLRYLLPEPVWHYIQKNELYIPDTLQN